MKIIIIGNGFDLSLGLKTSYKDFIESDSFTLLLKKRELFDNIFKWKTRNK